MADQKISDLNAATALADGDEVELLRSGSNLRADVDLFGGREYVLVAANDASATVRARADSVCTGADDDVEIQAALASDTHVALSAGTFTIGNMIAFTGLSDARLTGAGVGITTIKVANNADIAGVLNINTGTNVWIESMTLDGNKDNNSTDANGIRALSSGGGPLYCTDVEAIECNNGFGITAVDVFLTRPRVRGSAGSGIQQNIGGARLTVIDPDIGNPDTDGGDIVGDAIGFFGTYGTVIGGRAGPSNDTGINMSGNGHRVIGVEVPLNWNSGINTGGGNNLRIIGNECYANGRKADGPRSNSGIRIRDSSTSGTSDGVIVTGNRCYDDTSTYPLGGGELGQLYGIEIVNASSNGIPEGLVIEGNNLEDNLQYAIIDTDPGTSRRIGNNLGEPDYYEYGAAFEAVLTILGSTGVIIPMLDPHHGKAGASTFVSIGEYEGTFTWSEAPEDFDSVPISQGMVPVVRFNGTDEEADSPDDAYWTNGDASNDNAFSVGAWINLTNDATTKSIMGKYGGGATGREWRAYFSGTEVLTFEVYDESVDEAASYVADAATSTGAWVFVVVTYDGTGGATAMNGVTMYEDGASVAGTATNNANYVAMENTGRIFELAQQIGGNDFNGNMAGGPLGPFVTKKELSADEVKRLYQLGRRMLMLT